MKFVLRLVFPLIFLESSISIAQTTDPFWEVREDCVIHSSLTFYTHKTEPYIRAVFHPDNKGTMIIREYNDTLDEFLLSSLLSRTMSYVMIQYLNDSIWWLYGNRAASAQFPFIYRTTNAGLSWQTILQAWPEKPEMSPMSPQLHMFDMTTGIWLAGIQKNKIRYRITTDGGYTWKDKQIRVKRMYAQINKQINLILMVQGNSTKIKLNATEAFRRGSLFISNNRGRTFKKQN